MKHYFPFGIALCIIFTGWVLFTQSVLPFYYLEYKTNSTLRLLEFFSPSLWATTTKQSASGSTLSGSLLTQ